MLLSQEVTEGVEVLSVGGAVQGADAAALQQALTRAVGLGPRGVLVDLEGASALAPEVVDVLNWASASAGEWPRPVLAVCCGPHELHDLLAPQVRVHARRADAIAHMDDRPDRSTSVQVVLPDGPQGAREARRTAHRCADEAGFDGDDLALVVTELVTNALRHGAPPVDLEICTCAHGVTVVVSDAGPGRPAPRDPGLEDEGGRGLLLVEGLSTHHGVRSRPPGKAVWAELHPPRS